MEMTELEGRMRMRKSRSMATEFVTNGHPDKVCDQMADAIVDAALKQDPLSRVAMEVTGGHGLVAVIGEMTTSANFDIAEVVRATYRDIGHDHPIGVFVNVVKQSPDIGKGVSQSLETREAGSGDSLDKQGAGDQGIMVGYAVDDGPNCMPESWTMARMLAVRLREVRESGAIPYLRPDGKSQVTMLDGRVVHVTLAAHHTDMVTLEEVREDLFEHVVRYCVPDIGDKARVIEGKDPAVVINGTGRFVQGGFEADAGTTGRKLMIDNYGPNIEVGGGCYSGKDPSKVDRSAAYFCRMVAKSIVAGGHAREALVKVGYAIGVARPTYVSVVTDLTGKQASALEERVRSAFDFRPKAIVERLELLTPKGWRYRDAAKSGHYGDDRFPWEMPVDF